MRGGRVSIDGPLEGITVVDLTRVLAGPFCTLLLSDLGARVIKVEHPKGGDLARSIGPWFNGKSGYLMSINRGKESIALNLKQPGDLEILHRLLARADVVVENFRPGVMERLGLGWEELHPRYPRLIYAATSGFGHSGPYTSYAAFDLVAQAMGGVMSVTGHPGNPPTRVGTSIGDVAAGLFTAIGVNAALVHRAGSGEAIKVDVAMLDSQVAISENCIARYFAGDVPKPIGARHPSIAPFDAFPTGDSHIIIAAGDNGSFRRLCTTLGSAALLDDPRFADNQRRLEHQAELKEALSAALAADSADNWLRRLRAAGLPCGPINTFAEIVADPQIAARNMLVEVDDPRAGRVRLFGCPIKMSAFPDPHLRPTAPELDGDRDRILAGLARELPDVHLLALGDDEIAAYLEDIVPPYAAARAAADRVSLQAAERYAREQHAHLLPQGGNTPGHHFRGIVAGDGAAVGRLWLYCEATSAFLYDITIEPAQRRRGFASAALCRAEKLARAKGCTNLGLNLFTANRAAAALYARAGFAEASRYLVKAL